MPPHHRSARNEDQYDRQADSICGVSAVVCEGLFGHTRMKNTLVIFCLFLLFSCNRRHGDFAEGLFQCQIIAGYLSQHHQENGSAMTKEELLKAIDESYPDRGIATKWVFPTDTVDVFAFRDNLTMDSGSKARINIDSFGDWRIIKE